MSTIFWAIILIVAISLETVTFQLVSVWFAIGALLSCIASFFVDFPIQLAIFIVTSILMLILTRPLIKKHMNTKFQPTNHELNVGKIAIVTEPINKAKQTGRVSLDGIEWIAITETFEPIGIGSQVIVLKVEGAKLLVAKE